MKFYLNDSDVELLQDYSILDCCGSVDSVLKRGGKTPSCYAPYLFVTGSQVRLIIQRIFSSLPAVSDESDRSCLCEFGWRLTNSCL